MERGGQVKHGVGKTADENCVLPRRQYATEWAMNFALEHLGLPARDPLALKAWYVRLLDAKPVFADAQAPPFLLALPGGAMLEIYGGDLSLAEVSNNKLNGWRHVALRVDSLEAAKAELEKRGLTFTDTAKPAAGGGRVLFFQDPEGNLLHLVERPAGSTLL
jgi:glyoxylase I family protein